MNCLCCRYWGREGAHMRSTRPAVALATSVSGSGNAMFEHVGWGETV